MTMKRSLAVIAAAAALWATAPALAAPAPGDWTEVTSAADGKSKESVDRNSIVRTGPVVRFMQRSDYINDPDHWVSALVDVEINCETRQMRPRAMTLTLDNGKQRSETSEGTFEAVNPDTVGEDVMLYVCKKPGT